ncbi:HNH endonuclease [Planktothrix agardhii]|jgi:5-methylcytosine-specific restriction endonuclease McrA|uniref:HNH endonuclease n=1 Tax=Planktothrix agardhii TaxID=1160 RepID=UPI0028AFC83A|nr:HNH endonuclease signature motif containing protein [Planktothrix agardhii]
MVKRRSFSPMQKLIILQRANYRCEICGVMLTPDNFHADHKIPYSRGGKTEVYNGQALCSTCNLKKGNR